MNTDKVNALHAAYQIGLARAVEKYPEDYAFLKTGIRVVGNVGTVMMAPPMTVPEVAQKMMTAVANRGIRSVNINSEGWKQACRILGIKHTYKAIEEYLQ